MASSSSPSCPSIPAFSNSSIKLRAISRPSVHSFPLLGRSSPLRFPSVDETSSLHALQTKNIPVSRRQPLTPIKSHLPVSSHLEISTQDLLLRSKQALDSRCSFSNKASLPQYWSVNDENQRPGIPRTASSASQASLPRFSENTLCSPCDSKGNEADWLLTTPLTRRQIGGNSIDHRAHSRPVLISKPYSSPLGGNAFQSYTQPRTSRIIPRTNLRPLTDLKQRSVALAEPSGRHSLFSLSRKKTSYVRTHHNSPTIDPRALQHQPLQQGTKSQHPLCSPSNSSSSDITYGSPTADYFRQSWHSPMRELDLNFRREALQLRVNRSPPAWTQPLTAAQPPSTLAEAQPRTTIQFPQDRADDTTSSSECFCSFAWDSLSTATSNTRESTVAPFEEAHLQELADKPITSVDEPWLRGITNLPSRSKGSPKLLKVNGLSTAREPPRRQTVASLPIHPTIQTVEAARIKDKEDGQESQGPPTLSSRPRTRSQLRFSAVDTEPQHKKVKCSHRNVVANEVKPMCESPSDNKSSFKTSMVPMADQRSSVTCPSPFVSTGDLHCEPLDRSEPKLGFRLTPAGVETRRDHFPGFYELHKVPSHLPPKLRAQVFRCDAGVVPDTIKDATQRCSRPIRGTFNEGIDDPLDLYTPRFTVGVGAKKEGLCPICYDSPSGPKETWHKQKCSAYNYHLQIQHGISSFTKRPFAPPLRFRVVKRKRRTAYEREDMLQALCHACKKWIDVQSTKDLDVKIPELYFRKHAVGCHKTTTLKGLGCAFVQDDYYKRVIAASNAIGGAGGDDSPVGTIMSAECTSD